MSRLRCGLRRRLRHRAFGGKILRRRARSRLLLRVVTLEDGEGDAAVVRTTGVRVVRVDRLVLAVALTAEPLLVDAVARQPLQDRLGAPRGELLVVVRVADVVGV